MCYGILFELNCHFLIYDALLIYYLLKFNEKNIENIDKEKLKVVEEAAKIFEETLQIKLTKDEMYYIVSMI